MSMDAAMALVVDRSGSMYGIASDVRGNVKKFISDQKKESGKAFLTVAQFDHEYKIVHPLRDIQEIDEEEFAKQYAPRGSTALLDAIGRSTLEMKEKIDDMTNENKPKRVVIAVITDGLENASKEYNLAKIKEMIKERESAGWDFLFLGATLDAIKVAEDMGFSSSKAAVYDTTKFESSMHVFHNQFAKARKNEKVEISDEERKNLVKAS